MEKHSQLHALAALHQYQLNGRHSQSQNQFKNASPPQPPSENKITIVQTAINHYNTVRIYTTKIKRNQITLFWDVTPWGLACEKKGSVFKVEEADKGVLRKSGNHIRCLIRDDRIISIFRRQKLKSQFSQNQRLQNLLLQKPVYQHRTCLHHHGRVDVCMSPKR